MSFRYRYDDLDCYFCADMAEAGCPHELCPHIMDNLNDLRRDRSFVDAVEDAGDCVSYHTPTLMYLNSIGFPDERAMRLPPLPPPLLPPVPAHGGYTPECDGCPHPRVGLFCRSADGACTKTDYTAALERDKSPCPA